MDQYKKPGGIESTIDIPPSKATTVTLEERQIRSLEGTVKQLQDTVSMQQQEIAKLHRDIGRLKNDIGDIVNLIRNRG